MGKYDVNFKKLVNILLPIAVRKNIIEFIYTLLEPIRRLYYQFVNFIAQIKNKLSYNSQYPNLQRLLNDMFDVDDRRIEIRDNENSIPETLIFPDEELKPIELGQIIIYPDTMWGTKPFTVIVPAAILTEDLEKQIRRIVDEYKFAGTNYIIITK